MISSESKKLSLNITYILGEIDPEEKGKFAEH